MINFLLGLVFLSKVSLAFLGFFPKQFDPVIFQYGLHPYINIFLNLTIGGLLIVNWFINSNRLYVQSRFYRFFIFLTSLYLVFITLLQSFFVNPEESFILQMASAVMAVFTVYLYGRIIPTLLEPERLVLYLKNISVFLCFLSFIVLIISPASSFKGTRFIGVFKHIPHMVSCATIACFFIYYSIFAQSLNRMKLILNYSYLFLSFFLLILTGTRSALAAVLIGFFICLLVFKSNSSINRFLKASGALSLLLIILFFGHDIADYSFRVIRGQESIGQRMAQDGISSRLEEVQRGYELFEKNEWLGQGLLMKFSNGQEAEVTGYSANKDPHNIFVSAGVIGGWGFIIMTLIGYLVLIFAIFKSFFSKNKAIKILAIYLFTHLPILFIYHIHLSVGGIADRIYWLGFGYMVLKEIDLKKDLNFN